jgi:peptidoglycan/xylan/chitin deacetylase (PgdA/CDA1 family)
MGASRILRTPSAPGIGQSPIPIKIVRTDASHFSTPKKPSFFLYSVTAQRDPHTETSMNTKQLFVAMYHYVRDLEHSAFPQIKGMSLDDFRRQVRELPELFEVTTLEAASDFLAGKYAPSRNLCLLSFDDGLKEHYADVTPILEEHRMQGVFFPITSCTNDHVVAPVHMNHFVMAELGVKRYRTVFMEELRAFGLCEYAEIAVNRATARKTYPLDDDETAEFKYLFNFVLPAGQRDIIVKNLFAEWIGKEREFSSELYLSWPEAREMQAAGMVFGGHTHLHRPLARLEDAELQFDLETCWTMMTANLEAQSLWPFSYPYGKSDSFNEKVIKTLRGLGFGCAFSTENGGNFPGENAFTIRRVDCKQIMPLGTAGQAGDGHRNVALSAAGV